MSRYDLRPSLLEDILQEFDLVRVQRVEWRRLKKRHRTSVQDVGSAFPSMSNTRGDLAFPSVADFRLLSALGANHGSQ
jgi:hypothetical protein